MIHGVKETLEVRLYHVVIASKLELHRQFVYRIQGPYPRSIAITTAQEILLIDGFEEASGRHLQQLILHGGHIPSTLPLNPNPLWDSSRFSIRITPCGGSAAQSSGCAAGLSPTSSCACRTAPAPPSP